MKLEPVAWQFRFKHNLGEWRGCSSGDALLYGNLAECETRDLYAIPEGYVVVPVEQAKNAERYAWLRDKSFGQYAHPIVIEQRPEGFVPRYLGPLFGDILDSYVDIAIDQTANKAMLAAKEQQ